jgi:hypothetical protein
MAKVKHIALFKLKPELNEGDVERLFDELLDITEDIPGIDDYVAGANTSPEGLSHGYTHAFIMTFQDAAARDTYLAHPEHERLKNLLIPKVDAVLAFDFAVS